MVSLENRMVPGRARSCRVLWLRLAQQDQTWEGELLEKSLRKADMCGVSRERLTVVEVSYNINTLKSDFGHSRVGSFLVSFGILKYKHFKRARNMVAISPA